MSLLNNLTHLITEFSKPRAPLSLLQMPWLVFIYLFGVLCHFQHCTGHIMMGSWWGRGNQYIQFVRILYCKLVTNGKQLPAFPLEAMPETEPRAQRWEARVLPLCHCGPLPWLVVAWTIVTLCLENSSSQSAHIACRVLIRIPLLVYIVTVACHWSAVYSTEP